MIVFVGQRSDESPDVKIGSRLAKRGDALCDFFGITQRATCGNLEGPLAHPRGADILKRLERFLVATLVKERSR